MDEAKSPALTASVDSVMPQAIASAAAVAAAQPAPKPTAAVASQSAQSESVPLPTPKPTPVADAKTAKPAPKPQAPAAEPEDQAATEQKPRWAAMALAPADKDTVAKPKLSPKRTESAGGYNAKIWSALARHKPKTGKSGSASVTFAIGPGGGLEIRARQRFERRFTARPDGARHRAQCRALPTAAEPGFGLLHHPHLFPLIEARR